MAKWKSPPVPIPLDLLKIEQERIATQLGRIQEQLATADANYEQAKTMLADTLDLTRDCHAAYLEANEPTRRLFNQAFFTKIYIDEDDDTRERTVRVDYNQPFDDLLSRLVPARIHHDLAEVDADTKQTSRPENRTGGAVFTVGVHEGQGCPPSTLVELRGLEPLTPSMPWRCATSCATAPCDHSQVFHQVPPR